MDNIDKNKKYHLHIDGSYQHLYNLAAGGGCILDNDTIFKSFAEFLPPDIPNNYHEYFALSYSLEQCHSLGLSNISVQTDCLRLDEDVKLLLQYKDNENSEIQSVLNKLNLLEKIKNFNFFDLHYIPREQNRLADYVVDKFFTQHIEKNKLKVTNFPKKIYTNNNKIFQSPDITVSKEFLKNIPNQVVVFLMFNNVDSIKIKLLHYSQSDLNYLEKEKNIELSSKGWGKKVVTELGKFLNELDEKHIRVSFVGHSQDKLINYVRPNSELLDDSTKHQINHIYEKFDVINFSSFTDFTVQVKENYIDELNDFNAQKSKRNDTYKYKSFFFLAMKSLGNEIEHITQFLTEHNNNPFIKETSHLSVELKQKFFFEKFLNITEINNISAYLKQKEQLKNNGIKFKF